MFAIKLYNIAIFMEQATNPEHLNHIDVVVPVHELLQSPHIAAKIWPQLTGSSDFLEQITEHSNHIQAVEDIIAAVPDASMTLQKAVENDALLGSKVANLYMHLSELLCYQDFQRLILYMPNNWLPHGNWLPQDQDLASAIEEFKQDYVDVWYTQLDVLDVRANFVDGDVLESEHRTDDLPRTVMATHLIPVLVDRGLLTLDDVYVIRAGATNPVLISSIDEVLAVMNNEYIDAGSTRQPEHTVTEARRQWLDQKAADSVVTERAKAVSDHILNRTTQLVPVPPRNDVLARLAWVEGLQIAIDADAQGTIFEHYAEELERIALDEEQGTRQRFAKLFRHAFRQGLIGASDLSERGIPVTSLAGPLSKNLEYLTDEVGNARRIANSIATDPDIATYVYPVVAVGGSRLKGYGDQSADTDTCVFIKPNANHDAVQTIRERLADIFAKNGMPDRPIEFWLTKQQDGLAVAESNEPYVADKYWTHLLFNTAWVGSDDAIAVLQQKLLPQYFMDASASVHGRSERQLYLERLEQDLLQYRLLHKGYDRHYPPIPTNLAVVDKNSVFWDEGYRRVAAQLFVSAVFLPKL